METLPKFVSLDMYYPNVSEMSNEQIKFYKHFKDQIGKFKKVDINGSKSYAYLLAYEYLEDLINKGVSYAGETIRRLTLLNDFYEYLDLSWWIGDIHCYVGNFDESLKVYKLNPQSTQIHGANHILNIKYHLNLSVSAPEILCTGKKITKFGQENFPKMVEFVEQVLTQEASFRGKDYLRYISEKYPLERKYRLSLFNGYPGGYLLLQQFKQRFGDFKTFCYYAMPEFYSYCFEVSRSAENLLREDLNLPRVGEGWIAETELYYKVKTHFSSYKVMQHASPSWLGRQHLDIFFPDLLIAIEYHGRQHFEPKAFFGGQKSFEESQKRDRIKKEKCIQQHVNLIEVVEGYNMADIIAVIENYAASKK